MSEAVC